MSELSVHSAFASVYCTKFKDIKHFFFTFTLQDNGVMKMQSIKFKFYLSEATDSFLVMSYSCTVRNILLCSNGRYYCVVMKYITV